MSLLENHAFSLIASSVVNCLHIAYAMLVNANGLIPKEYRCAKYGTFVHNTSNNCLYMVCVIIIANKGYFLINLIS